MSTAVRFRSLSASEVAAVALDGAPLSTLSGEALLAHAHACGLPPLGDDAQTRLVLAALASGTGSSSIASDCWSEMRDEARGMLLLAASRDGVLSADTAAALNVLNQPQVVEKYKVLGNRWTVPETSRDMPSAVERARQELDHGSSLSTQEWLRGLADTLEAPANERPWWTSKPVLLVLMLSALFVLGHAALLVRVLFKVHSADNRVLLYPLAGLSASAVVGAFAVAVHRMSEPPKRA